MTAPRETSAHPTLLLLGGAGLPAWIWDDLVPALSAGGLACVVAPRPEAAPRAGLDAYADAALAAVPDGPVVAVGHSAGAVVALEVARREPDRVRGVLAVSGLVPARGGSFVSTLPFPQSRVLPLLLRVVGTRAPASMVRQGVAAGLDRARTDRLVADMVAEGRGLFTDRTGTGPLPAHRGYVVTTRDAELTVDVQRRSAERLESTWRAELPTGHLPMLEQPEALASVVAGFVAALGKAAAGGRGSA